MGPTEALMREWLDSTDENQRTHARNRIALGFDQAVVPAPSPPPDPRPEFRPSLYAAVRTCLYRDSGCGCVLPTCHANRGNWEDGRQSDFHHCLECLDLNLDDSKHHT